MLRYGRLIVATDDLRIAARVTEFGGNVRLTSPDHFTGTDRLAEVATTLDCDVVVNVQGDEPLFDPRAITELVGPFSDKSISVTTLYRRIQQPTELSDPNIVKVVLDRAGFPRPKICGEYLSPETGRILDRLGVLKALDTAGAVPLLGMRLIAP